MQKVVSAERRLVVNHSPLPMERECVNKDFWIDGHEGTFRVGFYPDGRIGEIFIDMAKEGSTLSGLLDAIALGVSSSLQRGVPMEVFIDKYRGMRFEPMGPTKDPLIPEARSIVDYIFSWIDLKYFQTEVHSGGL